MISLTAIQLPVINPELFAMDIGPFRFSLRWYALSYITGFLIAWVLFINFMKKPVLWLNHIPPMVSERVESLLTYNIVGIILGGRLGYVFLYNPAYYMDNPAEIFMIWRGGMAFHGAFAGLILATIVYCRVWKLPLSSVSDTISIVVTPGLFLGRIANFINAELYGRPTHFPLSVVFPDGSASVCPIDWIGPCSRHPTQLYEAVLEGLVLGSILLWLAYKRKWLHTPWRISGVFFAGYGLVRMFIEFLRQPDYQFRSADNPIGFALQFNIETGLTMGQLLSLPMIVIGICLIIYSSRRTS